MQLGIDAGPIELQRLRSLHGSAVPSLGQKYPAINQLHPHWGRVAPISFEQTYTLASPIDTHRTEGSSQVRRYCLEKRPTENCRRQQIEVVQRCECRLRLKCSCDGVSTVEDVEERMGICGEPHAASLVLMAF